GYWLVGCDGSLFHFGDARSLAGVRALMARHGGAATAVATKGRGFWVVASDGTIAAVGGSPPLTLTVRPRGPVVAAAASRDRNELWVVTAAGVVSTAGHAHVYRGDRVHGNVVAVAATPDGRGYWLANRAGDVFAFGD